LPQLDTEMLLYQDDDAELVQDCVMALAIAVWGVTGAGPVAGEASVEAEAGTYHARRRR
jgi:hypothetical protein